MTLILFQIFILAAGHAREASAPSGCRATEHWVSPHSRTRNGTSEFVVGHCRLNPTGYKFWKTKIHTSRPKKWPLGRERTKAWAVDEVELTLDSFNEIPDALWIKTITGIYRMHQSKAAPSNPATSWDGHIVLYDDAFKGPIPLSRVITHELAHERYRALTRADRRDYWFASGWAGPNGVTGDLNDKAIIGRKSGYVEEDGKTGPAEDFANNIEYFLYDPEKLKSITPHVYNWIKKRFSDNFMRGKARVNEE